MDVIRTGDGDNVQDDYMIFGKRETDGIKVGDSKNVQDWLNDFTERKSWFPREVLDTLWYDVIIGNGTLEILE